jgi:GT2 family glycosyltransferase
MSSSIGFSVVVPTFNRPTSLGECLSALALQDYPRQAYEVIVVDDGGSCDVEALLRPFAGEMKVRVVRQDNRGPASARNLGAAAAAGRFLAFTDDDCQPAPAWLGALDAKLTISPDRLAGGPVANALKESPYSVASQIISDFAYARYNSDLDQPRFFATNNISVSTALFHKMGGFDERFVLSAAEDREFCDAWQTCGLGLVWAPDALVYHRHSMGLGGFWRQHYGYGRGAFQYHRARRDRGAGRVPFEGIGFHVGIIVAPFRQRHATSPVLLAGLTALSQIAVASGYLQHAIAAAVSEVPTSAHSGPSARTAPRNRRD